MVDYVSNTPNDCVGCHALGAWDACSLNKCYKEQTCEECKKLIYQTEGCGENEVEFYFCIEHEEEREPFDTACEDMEVKK